MRELTSSDFAAMWPQASSVVVNGILSTQADVFAKNDISKAIRLVHLMAQISHECGGGTISEENMNYTHASRLQAVWPRRFPDAASAAPYLHNPRALANKVYNGRMGNRSGTDDGYNYRGHGLLQLTGRSSYRDMGMAAGVDLLAHPELANHPQYAFAIAVAEFKVLNCLPAADADDLKLVTQRVNGGTTGIDERRIWLGKWKHQLGM
jgi:putative chitinase